MANRICQFVRKMFIPLNNEPFEFMQMRQSGNYCFEYCTINIMYSSLLGIVSNLLNIIVFMDVEMRQQLVNHFLLALSISGEIKECIFYVLKDLLLLMCNFCFLVLPVLVVETDSFFWNNLFPQIIRYSYPLALTVQTSGNSEGENCLFPYG